MDKWVGELMERFHTYQVEDGDSGGSYLTYGVRRSVEKSLYQLHVFDVMNINGLFKAHHKPL